MMKLLKLEYYKNLNYIPFKVFTIMYFAILVIFLVMGIFDMSLLGGSINLKEQGMYNFPEIWNFTTWIVGLLKIFLGFIIVFSICQEFSNRMFKQNLIDGLSREEFIGSKLFTILVFTIISTVIVFVITLFLGLQYSETTENALIYEEMFFIGSYFLKLLSFFCFLMFLSVLLRKSMFVFLAFFVVYVAENIFLISEKSYLRDLPASEKLEKPFMFSNILPLESMANIIPNPLLRLKMAQTFGLKYEFIYPIESLVACIIWCTVFIIGSYWILKKRDW